MSKHRKPESTRQLNANLTTECQHGKQIRCGQAGTQNNMEQCVASRSALRQRKEEQCLTP